ncbi:MAG: hypothetical protein E7642_06345 [Ruminococcaceae bacterium]|nr:hypothetical protein [Oscillospiraceae bacterium]
MNKNSKLKKLIALALIFVFCVALLPLEIFAAENDSIWVGGVELTQSTPYLSVGGTAASAEKPQSSGYAHWDTSTNTLTLNDYTYSGTGYVYGTNNMVGEYKKDMTAAIYTTVDCSILLCGSNVLNNTVKSSDKLLGTGIYADGSNLTIKGTGSLDISANYNGIYVIYAGKKVLSFEGGNITISPIEGDTVQFRGIYSLYGSMIFKNNVNVTVDVKSRQDASNLGVTVDGSESTLTITDQANLTVLGCNKYGIYTKVCNTAISGNAKVNVTIEGACENGFYANNGALTVQDNAQLNTEVGDNPYKTTNGIYVSKDITVVDRASVSAKSEGGQRSYGIWTGGALTISGTPTVTAIAGRSTLEQINAGIYAVGAVSIMGGRLNAIGGASQGGSYGIYTETGIEIGEATVNANGGESTSGSDVWAFAGASYLRIVPNTQKISVFIGDTAADTPLMGSPFSQTAALTGEGSGGSGYEFKKYFLSHPNVHTHTMEYFYTDGTGHWQECSDENCYDPNKCKTEISEHDMTDATCTEAGKCQTEGCDYISTIDENAHADYSTAWKTDESEHWNECACGDKVNKAAHVDNNADNKCDTCNYEMPAHNSDSPTNPNNSPNSSDNPNNSPDSPNNTPDAPSEDKDGLSGGTIAGIAIGSVAVVGIGGFALFWFVIKKKKWSDLIGIFKK